jgi:SNF2 family DNA or RNA helicase
MRSQKPWRKPKQIVERLGISEMKNLLGTSSCDLVSLFKNCSIGSIKKKKFIRKTVIHNNFLKHSREKYCAEQKSTSDYYTQPDFGFELLVPFELFPHQIKAIKWAQYRESNPFHGISGGIMSLEMGLGKTLVALSLIASECHKLNLVLCNKSLLGSISQDTVKFFGDKMPFFILHQEQMKDKMEDLNIDWFSEYKFILTTYDVLVILGKWAGIIGDKMILDKMKLAGRTFFALDFHRVICDESQRFVNSKSQVYKCLKRVQCTHRLCLTGTPIRNYDYDLHTQLTFCGLKASIKWSRLTYKKLNLRHAIYCTSMAQADIQLPEKKVIQLDLDFTEAELNLYNSILNHSLDIFTSFNNGKSNFAAVLLQFLRLRQVCIAPYMINDKKDISIELDQITHGYCSTKILRTVQIVNDIPVQDKIIIFSSFTSALSLVQDALKHHLNFQREVLMVHGGTSSKKRELLFDQFRNITYVRVLLITNNVGCMGLNLTEANHVVLLEPWWNDTIGDQASARAWRIGQTKTVHVWRLIMNNSIEQRMLNMCQAKNRMTDTFLKENSLSKEMILEIFQP